MWMLLVGWMMASDDALTPHPGDAQALLGDRGHVVRRAIDQQHIVAGGREVPTRGAANGARADDRDPH
jgi:hypothetical protein